MDRNRRGLSLVELLIVTAIVGLLISILLPAVQAAREAARRVECQSNLRQQMIALVHYHDVHGSFPSGILSSNLTLWSGQLLPQIEQIGLYSSLNFNVSWDADGTSNEAACGQYLSLFRCPSSVAPRYLAANGIPDRMPCNYIACTSGLVARESGPPPHVGMRNADGLFAIDSRVRLSDVLDGASNTIAVGEAVFIYESIGRDNYGLSQFLDHWHIGTVEGLTNEISESMGSTAAPINGFRRRDLFVEEIELSFSSRHPGGTHVSFADGHVKFVAETIDRSAWSALGTRAHHEVAIGH